MRSAKGTFGPQHPDQRQHPEQYRQHTRRALQFASHRRDIERRNQRDEPGDDQDLRDRGRPRHRDRDRDREPVGQPLQPRAIEGAADPVGIHRIRHRVLPAPQRHILAAARENSVAVLRQQSEHVGAPLTAGILDQHHAGQQAGGCVAQERHERQILRALHVDLQRVDRRDAGLVEDREQRPARHRYGFGSPAAASRSMRVPPLSSASMRSVTVPS